MDNCANCHFQSREGVQDGDWLYVREEYFLRGGECGEVDYTNKEGCGLDFYTSRVGPPDYISQEFWEWGELEVCACPDSLAPPGE